MIHLTRKRGHPVYLQIKEQLERRIASGALTPGASLPSVRVLAQQLSINPNTVVRAYRELEALGLVVSRHGEGTFVSSTLRREEPALRLLNEHAHRYARAAHQLGAELEVALNAVQDAWKKETDHD